MKLLKLQLLSFRSYDKKELSLDKNTLVITGENGIGKTNILEAIYFLSTGKTFRGSDQENLIKFGMDYFVVKGEVAEEFTETKSSQPADGTSSPQPKTKKSSEITSLEVLYSNYPRKQKVFKINDVVTPHAKYLGNLITVLFHPKDLNLLYMEPSLRRKYINLLLSQTDKFYLEHLSNYTKIIKQRNALLEEISQGNVSQDELDTWDEKLAIEGANIILKRVEAIGALGKHLQKTYQKISGGKEKVEVKYSSTITLGTQPEDESQDKSQTQDQNRGTKRSPEEALHLIKSAFTKKLLLKRDKDIRYGSTSVGPHRDDIKFTLDDRPIEEFASRGESRTLLISLKISEIEYIEKKTKTSPILLLDDVFSELDENRQKYLLEALSKCQTIITSVDVPKDLEGSENVAVLEL